MGGGLLVLVALAATGLSDVNHVVVRGESLWSLAQRYATTPAAIASANHVANPNLIAIGMNLRIAGVGPGGASTTPVASRASAAPTTYRVVAGDNLSSIAARHRVTAQALALLNGIPKANLVRVGQVLRIPVPAPTPAAGPNPASPVRALIVRYSAQYRVSPGLVEAVAWQESGWQQKVVSSTGALGVMQIMPATGVFVGTNLVGHPIDPANIGANVEAGVAFLAYLLRMSGGQVPLAVASYYQGFRSVSVRGMFTDTKAYVASVLALEQRFGA